MQVLIHLYTSSRKVKTIRLFLRPAENGMEVNLSNREMRDRARRIAKLHSQAIELERGEATTFHCQELVDF